jgi:hypothetical protein
MGISLEGSFVAENIVNELFGNKGMEWSSWGNDDRRGIPMKRLSSHRG